ncbi:MAG: NADH-quinone oxidoreductase subunit H [Elusimicrobiota bacterium]
MKIISIINLLLALSLAPLFFCVTGKTKNILAGRKGVSILQVYFDLYKLFNKGIVYSRTTGFVFRMAPIIISSAIVIALFIIPIGFSDSIIRFDCDLIVFVYLFALIKYFMVSGALDTGSSFEGMGASREILFSLFSEITLFIILFVLVVKTKALSLSVIYGSLENGMWMRDLPSMILLIVALFIVFLVENSRVPIDDPNTHLELTMIHEVMILDNSGVDLGLILYTSAIKYFIFCALIISFIPFRFNNLILNEALFFAGIFLLSIFVGFFESAIARARFKKVPRLIILAAAFSILALILVMR